MPLKNFNIRWWIFPSRQIIFEILHLQVILKLTRQGFTGRSIKQSPLRIQIKVKMLLFLKISRNFISTKKVKTPKQCRDKISRLGLILRL